MKVRFKQGWRRAYATMTPGNVYRVLGIERDALRIIDDLGEPILFAPQAFEVVDATEPVDWISERADDGERYAYPPELRRPAFSFERWHDGDPAARAQLARHVRERCWREAGEPANDYLRVRRGDAHVYVEFDEARWVVRKVEVHADGRMTYATGNARSGTTLDDAPMLDDDATAITREELEAVWDQALERD